MRDGEGAESKALEPWDWRQAGKDEADQRARPGLSKSEKESREVGQLRIKADTWAALSPQGQGGRG